MSRMDGEDPNGVYGIEPTEERQKELRAYLARWHKESNHEGRLGPFDIKEPGSPRGVFLTGGDVYWLAEQVRDKYEDVPDLHLEGANLSFADLRGASLRKAHLEGADLWQAHLEDADLVGAHLEGVNLGGANLAGADLREVWLDSKSVFGEVTLDAATRLGDIHWNGIGSVNLTQIVWEHVPTVGDEHSHPVDAVRAYRQLAVQLRAQGLVDHADRFAYRAQFLQRQVLRRQRRFGAYVGSVLLDAVSGYGYRPVRSVVAYILIIGLFTGAYLLNAQFAAPHLTWDEALVLSISSFHGRGFFTTGINLGDTLARLAAGEAIVGLLIEITFIATFTQRFFAR